MAENALISLALKDSGYNGYSHYRSIVNNSIVRGEAEARGDPENEEVTGEEKGRRADGDYESHVQMTVLGPGKT